LNSTNIFVFTASSSQNARQFNLTTVVREQLDGQG
jgi:hypothetical protein